MPFRRSKAPFRRRYLVILTLFVVLAAALVVRFNILSQTSPQHMPREVSPPSPYCRSGNPMAGVYNPLRVRVLSKCEVASGVVEYVTLQESGDQQIYVRLDPQYAKLLAMGNSDHPNALLVLEVIPEDQAAVPVPIVGQHISFVGPWVYDSENHWNAIYPVWSIRGD
jgi:hypothetical protein